MSQFALLEHQGPFDEPRDAQAHGFAGPGGAPSTTERRIHWDLLLDVEPTGPLVTFRLAENPLVCAAPIPATRIGDHRRVYLEYEGPLTGGRGAVTRLDRGPAQITQAGSHWRLRLDGARLRGSFEIGPNPAGMVHFLVRE